MVKKTISCLQIVYLCYYLYTLTNEKKNIIFDDHDVLCN